MLLPKYRNAYTEWCSAISSRFTLINNTSLRNVHMGFLLTGSGQQRDNLAGGNCFNINQILAIIHCIDTD
jgi:hypothetical protein